MLPLLLLACTGSDGTDGPSDLAFVLPTADVGTPLTGGTGFDPADGAAIGLVLDHLLPVFDADASADPAWDTPAAVWALLQPETVRDPGVCPFERVDGDVSIHEGGCRSSGGYEFTGDVSERTWEEGGAARYRFEADVEVIGDTESANFDRVRIVGALERAVPDDDSVDAHLDVNLRIEVAGYWERREQPDDPRARAWASWTVSGSIEHLDGTWVTDVAADIGGSGGLRVESAALTQKSTCPIEAVGEAWLGEGVTATFEGAASCDACATVVATGGTEVLACAPD
ncbi:MAG: hypothetical protein Q8P41_21285 [Pseudomonadota bacterium]|nr:hypothetical protein [Pseudomonadota bacterium]